MPRIISKKYIITGLLKFISDGTQCALNLTEYLLFPVWEVILRECVCTTSRPEEEYQEVLTRVRNKEFFSVENLGKGWNLTLSAHSILHALCNMASVVHPLSDPRSQTGSLLIPSMWGLPVNLCPSPFSLFLLSYMRCQIFCLLSGVLW